MTSVDMRIIEDDFPASAVLKVERPQGYGAVPDLEQEELADPRELERQAFVEEWGPLLALPWEIPKCAIRPVLDEFGQWDWGAFGTVDFQRTRPPFSKTRYKLEKLQEELRNAMIALSVVQERLSMSARLEVVEAIRCGVDDPDHFDGDRWFYANRYLHARRLRREINAIRTRSERRGLGPDGSR